LLDQIFELLIHDIERIADLAQFVAGGECNADGKVAVGETAGRRADFPNVVDRGYQEGVHWFSR